MPTISRTYPPHTRGLLANPRGIPWPPETSSTVRPGGGGATDPGGGGGYRCQIPWITQLTHHCPLEYVFTAVTDGRQVLESRVTKDFDPEAISLLTLVHMESGQLLCIGLNANVLVRVTLS